MKHSDPKYLALINAGAIAAFAFVATLAFGSFSGKLNLLFVLGLSLGLGLFSYVLIRFTVQKFIYDKIRLIYKSIRQVKSKKGDPHLIINKDTIGKVEADVVEWGLETEDQIDELMKMEAYRREFVGNVAHELKTPIFNIQGYILTLLDGGLDDPNINKDYLLRTESSITRMITILEDLDAITRLESGELKLDNTNFDMVTLSMEIFDFLEIKAKTQNVELLLPGEESSFIVNADRERIGQVLTNLIDNAIKYIGENHQNSFVKVDFFDMDEHYLIEVSDNGRGISQENITRVFERFYRTDKGRSRDQGGSGLGLAIVKHIIEAHGETINVRSNYGEGTTFSFTLQKGRATK
ncbi:MAG: GHKL domain-containing protein [Bacteroidales bacterium]|nr:GHKL domain-containing protein [Bacteroidales bacterium]